MDHFSKKITLWLQHYHQELSLDAHGACYISVNKQLQVLLTVSSRERVIRFYCPLFRLGGASDYSMALRALTINLYKDSSIQGTLGYDDQTSQLVYSFILSEKHDPEALQETQFRAVLNDFISNCQTLIKRFEQAKASEPAPASRAIQPLRSHYTLALE